MKNGIIKRHIDWITSEAIYVWDKFFSQEEAEEEYPEIIEIDPPKWGGGDPSPIQIEEVMKILQDLKEEGCSHVEIDWHCDHLEYEFYGYEIRKATPEEMEAETKRQIVATNRMKRDHIQKLKDEIKKLEDGIQE